MRSLSDQPGEKRPFCVVPVRALADRALKITELRILMGLGHYANRAGVCWPSMKTMSDITGIDASDIAKSLPKLLERGYIRQLQPNDYDQKKGAWGYSNRYQVLWRGDEPAPTYEEVKDANLMQPHDVRDPIEGSGARGADDENVYMHATAALGRAWSAAVEQMTGNVPSTPDRVILVNLAADGVTADDLAASTRRLILAATANRRGLPSFLEVAEAARQAAGGRVQIPNARMGSVHDPKGPTPTQSVAGADSK